jgi:hypothetical protein
VSSVISMAAYRASVRLDGTTLTWQGERRQLDREQVRAFCEGLERAIYYGKPGEGAGFRFLPCRRLTITIVGCGMGPMVLPRAEAWDFGIRLMSAARALPLAELGPVA